MITEIDESLRRLVLRDAVDASGVELSFESPTKDWVARRSAPTISVYLYDLREDVERREVQPEQIRDETGKVIGRKPPPRRYRLSYLVSVWTQRPEDEHRLLASLLACFLANEVLPADVLDGALAKQAHRVYLRVAHPPAKDRALADVWTALGGELKPALDLVVNMPFDAARVLEAGPPVLEPLELRIAAVDPPATRVPLPAPPPVPGTVPESVPGSVPVTEPEPVRETGLVALRESEPERRAEPAPPQPAMVRFEVVRRRRWWSR